MKKTAEVLSIIAALVALAVGVKIIADVVACEEPTKEFVHEVEPADFSITPAPSMEWGWEISEPNEPEDINVITWDANSPTAEWATIAISVLLAECSACGRKFDIDESHFCLQQYIPTWPTYIELEKDLVIHRPGKTLNEFHILFFNKGTQIYLKEPKDKKKTKKLTSLEDYNKEQSEIYILINEPTKNGIACPECGKELYDTNNGIAYPTYPMQYPIHCECGWSGTKI